MNITSPHRLIRALNRQAVDATPVWMMRQAGRYLPEYRALREQAGGFLAMCQNPELAAKITLQPLARFPQLDAAIIFSDILTIPDAMGLGLAFGEGEGPCFECPIRSRAEVENLPDLVPEEHLGYVLQAIRFTAQELADKLPIIGFCGSPWTVATYMVEGKSSKNFSLIKSMMVNSPEILLLLLNKLAKASSDYLLAQVEAGVQALMIFDTWGGVLTPQAYRHFSLHFMQKIVTRVKAEAPNVPIILFTKGGGQWLDKIAATGCDAVQIDWTVDIKRAREWVGENVALQGNMDPAMLYAKPEIIANEVKRILTDFGAHPGHVFNLGHGIYPDIPPEHVAVMIETIKQFSPQFHE